MKTLWQDIRFGIRMLLKSPGITLISVIALALGIGANSAIFSVVNGVLLRPLPYKDPDRLMLLWDNNPSLQIGLDYFPTTASNFIDWRDQNQAFENLAAFDANNINLTGVDVPERIGGARVTADFFKIMGVEPILGRTFLPEEDQPGSNQVTVISHGFWQRRFNKDPNITGKTLNLDGKVYTIVGVMPEGFQFPKATDLPAYMELPQRIEAWTPMAFSGDVINQRGNHNYAVVGRLKHGVSLENARAEMNTVAKRLEEKYPKSNTGFGVTLIQLNKQITGEIRPALLVLLGAVGFVLLIACANVANLLLARSSARQKEIAIRTALGATRSRIIKQFLTESLLLSLFGAAAGILLALWGIDILVNLNPENIPRLKEIGIDGRVFGFTLALTFITGILFGLVPALQASRVNLNDSLKEGSRGLAGGIQRNRIRSLLVVAEVALSLVLLIGAGLLIKSFTKLRGINPGFNPENVLTMVIQLPRSNYKESNKQIGFYQQVLQRISTLPGVESAGIVSELPLSGAENIGDFAIEGRPQADPSQYPLASQRSVSSDYFRVMQIPLIKGRYFTEQDNQNSEKVILISENFALKFFQNEDPIGKRIRSGDSENPWFTIVGVVGDVKHNSLSEETKPHIYRSYLQQPRPSLSLVIRTAIPPEGLSTAVRKEIWAVDKDQPVPEIKSMEKYLYAAVSQKRFNMLLLGIFAGVALILASVGIYGVMSYSVSQRTHEIGIRMALGANRSDVLRLIVGQGMVLALIGVALGLAVAFALTRLLSTLLFGVSATDPATFALISILLSVVAFLASYIPALRAIKIDPIVALRHE